MGRKMTAAERKAVSRRMKKYWAGKRADQNGHAPKRAARRTGVRFGHTDITQLARLGAEVRLTQIDEERRRLEALLKTG